MHYFFKNITHSKHHAFPDKIYPNWKSALHFGPVLFRVELQPGTRILDLDLPPDPCTLDRLRRENGHEIFTCHPLQVIPRNKRLTLDLMIQPMHLATNPDSENTRKWFHEANRMLSV